MIPDESIPTFTLKLYEKHEKEVTDWKDAERCFEPGDTHIVLGRDKDHHERHLWGKDADEFMRLLGAPEAWR